MNALDMALTLHWLPTLQTYVAHVVVFDEELTYLDECYYEPDALVCKMMADNAWVRTCFTILEQRYPEGWPHRGTQRVEAEQLRLFPEP